MVLGLVRIQRLTATCTNVAITAMVMTTMLIISITTMILLLQVILVLLLGLIYWGTGPKFQKD